MRFLYDDACDSQRKNRKHQCCKWVPLALILRASQHIVLALIILLRYHIDFIFLARLFGAGVYVVASCVFPLLFSFFFILSLRSFSFVIAFFVVVVVLFLLYTMCSAWAIRICQLLHSERVLSTYHIFRSSSTALSQKVASILFAASRLPSKCYMYVKHPCGPW